ncbi:radical SAM domain iron-sulfur cluster-binding oxidoreductase [Syntrophotalea carbinolica DSM 2380]|uniref:Radical SAM domain iron-sulfur cluster-binding oxidoreductase n=1 Tax=Syntrophotalea carbinolica (strain DSM 2380 / NBRC 103641 / GraBd1) TaxID=338963 RepID=Q3A179_SYNC1|nr:radical SAM protein [Syntrophotalea carbinolica]ABA89878.1 radical SAM domain iron-sulfur cluster-binding oxidoreductase [Syntrophotalea carbinolica DSM 2380]
MQFTEPLFRPPMEVNSVLVRGTQGCTYNKCNFCYMAQGYDFMKASPEHMESELLAQKHSHGSASNIFIIGCNPLSLPQAILLEYAGLIQKHYPRFTRISMHSRVDDIERKSDKELKLLQCAGFGHLYVGTENGNEEALRKMNKGHGVQKSREQLRRLDAAGIKYTCQYIIGMAGKGMGVRSGLATAKFINSVHAERVMSTGLTVFPGSRLQEIVARGEFVESSEREKIEEMLVFFENLTADIFFEGIHYLNPLHFRFQTGYEKARYETIEEIKRILNSYSEDQLEKAINRKEMRSL